MEGKVVSEVEDVFVAEGVDEVSEVKVVSEAEEVSEVEISGADEAEVVSEIKVLSKAEVVSEVEEVFEEVKVVFEVEEVSEVEVSEADDVDEVSEVKVVSEAEVVSEVEISGAGDVDEVSEVKLVSETEEVSEVKVVSGVDEVKVGTDEELNFVSVHGVLGNDGVFDVNDVAFLEVDVTVGRVLVEIEDLVCLDFVEWEVSGQRVVETKVDPLFVVVIGLNPVVIGMVEQALFLHEVMVTTVVEISGTTTVVSSVSMVLAGDEDSVNCEYDEDDDAVKGQYVVNLVTTPSLVIVTVLIPVVTDVSAQIVPWQLVDLNIVVETSFPPPGMLENS